MPMQKEEGKNLTLDFSKLKKISFLKKDVLPVIVQEEVSKEVLLLAYVNQEALKYSIIHKEIAFWSTSRNELWIKGKTSSDYLDLIEIRVNCEQNSLLYVVSMRNHGCCHTKNSEGKTRETCFYRSLVGVNKLSFLPGME